MPHTPKHTGQKWWTRPTTKGPFKKLREKLKERKRYKMELKWKREEDAAYLGGQNYKKGGRVNYEQYD
jgi:hypothetical protein